MKVFDTDPNLRWLFCMTHPDDEISICAWIQTLAKQGNEVYISWTHHTPTREAEAKKVAGLLGVPDDRLFFHGAPDGAVCEHLAELQPKFEKMVGAVQPDRIACGAFEQGHLDHDSTNLLVNKSFNGTILEIPFYHTYLTRRPTINRFAQPAGQEIIQLPEGQQELKKLVARQYPSQAIWRNLVLDEWRRMVTKPKSDKLFESERMRVQTHKDFLTPHLPPALADRVSRSAKWARWRAAAQAIL
jgi:LmbE family N-acetylglucosaminyl deacetylase